MNVLYLSMLDREEDKILFEQLHEEHKNIMYAVAFKILKDKQLSEDAVYEAFLSFAANIEKIKGKNCIQIRNYLIIIVRNAALRIYNSRKMEICVEHVPDDSLNIYDMEVDIEERSAQRELFKLIKSLDEKYSDVLILKYYYGMKVNEIAASLGISRENVKIRLVRGREMLKKKMREDSFYDGQTV